MLKLLIYVLIGLGISFNIIAEQIRYPNIDGLGKSSIGYAVLTLALEKSESDYQLIADSRTTNIERTRALMDKGRLDVYDSGFNPELDKIYDPIYLPLEMGLLGWRVFIVHQDLAKRLSSVQSIEDLRAFTYGQGQGWGDIPILENAGLKVITAPRLDNLIQMVEVKRFDILPLGATEAYSLLDKFTPKNSHLIVDSAVTLIYPFGRFFYVKKGNKKLKEAIEIGMERALSDGSLLSLLKSHPFSRDAFKRTNLEDRVQIRIESPTLTDEFKAIDPKWWFRP